MPIRLAMAWGAGFAAYMVAMAMTTYDGVLSLVFQPIVGAIITTAGVGLVVLPGIPLLFRRPWSLWSRLWWVSLCLVLAGVGAMLLSWHPQLRVEVFNPDLHQRVESFHPVLLTSGWFLTLFGLAWCPLISIRNFISWIRKHRLGSSASP